MFGLKRVLEVKPNLLSLHFFELIRFEAGFKLRKVLN